MKNWNLLFIHRNNKSIYKSSYFTRLTYYLPYWYLYLGAFLLLVSAAIYFFIQAFFVDVTSKNILQGNNNMQRNIASQIIRFHVIANSDSEEDQTLKLKVKETLIEAISPNLSHAKSIDEAREILIDNLSVMEEVANQVITDNGYNYTVTASLEYDYFPLKVYGDLSLPPGEYEAVRVEIGSAKGQNWWCIMFPPLCFVDATYSVVPNESKSQLKNVLTDDEYTSVFPQEKHQVRIGFKIINFFRNLFS